MVLQPGRGAPPTNFSMSFLARSYKARLMKTLFISWRSTMVVFWNGSLGLNHVVGRTLR